MPLVDTLRVGPDLDLLYYQASVSHPLTGSLDDTSALQVSRSAHTLGPTVSEMFGYSPLAQRVSTQLLGAADLKELSGHI